MMIEAHLARVVESRQFADTTRLKRFLIHIVTETLEGRSDTRKGYPLGVDVFDKPADFDPGSDTIVRVRAARAVARLRPIARKRGATIPFVSVVR